MISSHESRRISSLLSSHHTHQSHPIPSHRIISYILSSLIISNIIYHHFPHLSSSIFFNPVKKHCPIMHSFPPPPLGLKFPILSLYVSMPLFSPMNIKHPSIRETTNGRRFFGFGPVSTFDRPGPLPQHTSSWNCSFAVPVGVQGYSGSSQPDSWNLRHAWKSCIKLHRLHRLHRLHTFTFMLAMSAHCPKRLQHIWMSLDSSLGRLGDIRLWTSSDHQWPSVTQWRSPDRLWLCKSLWGDAGWDMLGLIRFDRSKFSLQNGPFVSSAQRSRQGNWFWWWCASHLQRLEWWMLTNVGH